MTLAEDWTGAIADGGDPLTTTNAVTRFEGRIWSVVTEDVDFGGHVVSRDVLVHPGAVVVIALDPDDRVLLIRQYRHPVRRYLFEPPAGLLDVAGEPPAVTAARELAEEAGYEANEWHVLVDLYNTPGGSSEAIRVYLARDLRALPDGRQHTGEAEEAHLPRAWVDLDVARDLVLDGSIGSPSAVAGILAACVARQLGWSSLRPVDAPWGARDALVRVGRISEEFVQERS